MIELTVANIGSHTVRFLPNIGNLNENVQMIDYYYHGEKQITKKEYWDLRGGGVKALAVKRYFSYANVDGYYGLFMYGKQLRTVIKGCMQGKYFFKEGNIYLEENLQTPGNFENYKDYKKYFSTFTKFEFKPFNIFDLRENKAVRFNISNMERFMRLSEFEIIEGSEFVIYKEGDNKDDIKNLLNFYQEYPPESLTTGSLM